jgi:polyribonucleotide nucleotidyltransferase
MFDKIIIKEIDFGGCMLRLETGKVGRHAHSVIAQMGETVVLCAAVAVKKHKEGVDFFPLTVNYFERYYAAGKFPGGFFKRENRPTEREVLISRLIDRPIRPLFPNGFCNEVQVTCTVLSYDSEHQPDIVATIAASAALAISGAPFDGPIGAARVGYKDGEFVLNPSASEIADGGLLDLVVAGTKDAVLMVESEAKELPEEIMLEAVKFGHKSFKGVIEGIEAMAKDVGNERWEVELFDHTDIIARIEKIIGNSLISAYKIVKKQARNAAIDELKHAVKLELIEKEEFEENRVNNAFKELQSKIVRNLAIQERRRIDGRGPENIRKIAAEVDVLPRVHGSALFTRGETQALVITTLGVGEDRQMVDDIEGIRKDRFTLHYNFPAYSVGETGPMRAPGRREIGHGKLAFRALSALIPSEEVCPYTIRVVSEITESNGSSSMASVCGASLSLMAAGVPIRLPIAGIAMGLIKEGDDFVVLSDIMGDEDHLGDMDFKVAGTDAGITALQMDIKIKGITEGVMKQALSQAKEGRKHIISCMAEALTQSRSEISRTAPQIHTLKIPKEKIGELIGPGGKVIKEIVEKTGAKIDINDDGVVNVASTSGESMEAALAMIKEIVTVPEIGALYDGKVVKVTDFGAFVAIMRNCEGLVHVSEMSNQKVKHPRDFVSEGQIVKVKVIDIDGTGRIKLSMKAAKSTEDPSFDEDASDEVESIEPREEKGRNRNTNPKRGPARRSEKEDREERDDYNRHDDESHFRKNNGKRKFKRGSNYENDEKSGSSIGDRPDKKLRFF